MKRAKKVVTMLLALMLVLSLCGFAMAEGESDSSTDTSTENVLKEAEEKNQVLSDALAAYNTAKQESRKKARLASLKEELDKYVAAGAMTQEQADLVLSYYAEQLVQNANGIGRSRGGKGLRSGLQDGKNAQDGLGRGGKRGGKSQQTPTAPQSGNSTASPEGNGV